MVEGMRGDQHGGGMGDYKRKKSRGNAVLTVGMINATSRAY